MDSRELADKALRLYLASPGDAQRLALDALRESRRARDPRAGSTAQRTLGLIAQHLHDFATAAEHLRAAVELGTRAADPMRVAEARTDLAYNLAHQGRTRLALRQLTLAEPMLGGQGAGWTGMTKALVLKYLGRWDEALAVYQRALERFRRAGDVSGEAAALTNRGVVHIYRGTLAAAEADLLRAERLSIEHDQHLTRAISRHNLGYLFATRGDLPAALSSYDDAEKHYSAHRSVPLELWIDRCEVLLAAGLPSEARVAAGRAVDDARLAHQHAELAEARLRLAQACLADGDPRGAREAANAAARAFIRQRRPAWAALARFVTLLACLEGGEPLTAAHARRAAGALERAGWAAPARDARMIAARLDLDRGVTRIARADLRLIARGRLRGTVSQRAQSWHAEALLRLSDGRPRAARRAAARGLDLIEDYRSTLGATDLRAGASRPLRSLAELGLRLALDDGRPETVLEWAERSRAAHLIRRPTRPPADETLAGLLVELRRVVVEYEESVRAGHPRPGLRSEQISLERAIRDRSRLVPGPRDAASAPLESSADLSAALGDRALVEYVVLDGRLHAVALAGGRLGLRQLGDVARVEQELRTVPFLLRRLATASTGGPRVEAAMKTLEHVGQRLSEALIEPLAAAVGERPLVVVPSGALQDVPWALLPLCRGRPVSVSPSARLWLAAATGPDEARQGTVLVAGPDLEHADLEVKHLADHHAGVTALVASNARVRDVLQALDGAWLAHLAAHGDFRADNAQFSSLRLHDGPLTVYDLERLERAPRQVVLSACESGRSAVLVGDELLGLAAAFLTLGTRGLVASVVHVPDAETVSLMVDVHDRLRGGDDLPAALAAAQVAAGSEDPRRLAAALAFVSFGSG